MGGGKEILKKIVCKDKKAQRNRLQETKNKINSWQTNREYEACFNHDTYY